MNLSNKEINFVAFSRMIEFLRVYLNEKKKKATCTSVHLVVHPIIEGNFMMLELFDQVNYPCHPQNC